MCSMLIPGDDMHTNVCMCADISLSTGLTKHGLPVIICDMNKRNESDVRNIVFEILAKTVVKFFGFILFLSLINFTFLTL